MSEAPPETVQAFIGVGSNMQDPRQQLSIALQALHGLPACRVVRQSSVYESSPFGPVSQANFMNAVVELQTGLAAEELLQHLQRMERAQGRAAGTMRWGPRIIDLDILLYGTQRIDLPHLHVPHPGIAERNFVLFPLCELAPHLEIPGLGTVLLLKGRLAASGATLEKLGVWI